MADDICAIAHLQNQVQKTVKVTAAGRSRSYRSLCTGAPPPRLLFSKDMYEHYVQGAEPGETVIYALQDVSINPDFATN